MVKVLRPQSLSTKFNDVKVFTIHSPTAVEALSVWNAVKTTKFNSASGQRGKRIMCQLPGRTSSKLHRYQYLLPG